ncbi:MAG: glutamine amidotransferase-related protein, partial [Bacteroidia bacterium]
GMQAIGEAFGARLKNLETVYHGIATPITVLEKAAMFSNCPEHFNVGRYHSWVVDALELPASLKITAEDGHKNIMALTHLHYDVKGVQFHPESILSEQGETILRNWLQS